MVENIIIFIVIYFLIGSCVICFILHKDSLRILTTIPEWFWVVAIWPFWLICFLIYRP